MKTILKLSILLIALMIGACGEKPEKITFTTAEVAVDWQNSKYVFATLKRVAKGDDVKLFTLVRDTLRDENKLPLYDSSGKVKMGARWDEIPPEFVVEDKNIDWEKRQQEFEERIRKEMKDKGIIPDTTKKK